MGKSPGVSSWAPPDNCKRSIFVNCNAHISHPNMKNGHTETTEREIAVTAQICFD